MYAYLVSCGAGLDPAALERALRRGVAVMPEFQHRPVFHTRALPELEGGWSLLRPDPAESQPLLQERVEEDLALLFFGELFGPEKGDPCHHLLHLWRKEGDPEAIHRLNGNFVVFLADRRQRRLHVVGDALGRRLPRLLHTPHGLVAASQDLLLLATGRASAQRDAHTAAVQLVVGWPQGGHSLLPDVTPMQPRHRLTLEGGLLKRHELPSLMSERIEPHPEALRRHVQLMLECLGNHMAGLFAGRPQVSVDLTGGVDSRVVCALTRSLRPPDTFLVECSGGSRSPEVAIARRLCREEGLVFRRVELAAAFPAPEAFERTLTALAFFQDGAGDARYALRTFPAPGWETQLHLHGTGGEVFRGRFYLKAGAESFKGRSPAALTEHLRAFLVRAQAAALLIPEAQQELTRRLGATMDEGCARTSCATDALDLFYLQDRIPFWGMADARVPWLRWRISPYLFPDLVRLGLQLPAPVGVHGMEFYREAVRRYLPRGWEIPTVTGSDALNPALAPVKESPRAKAWRYYRQRLRGLVAPRLPMGLGRAWRDSNELRGDYFARDVADRVRTLLLAPEALLREVVVPGELERLVQEHLSGFRYHSEVIGSALVVEKWRESARQVESSAREEHPS